jgi:hypothetical protein
VQSKEGRVLKRVLLDALARFKHDSSTRCAAEIRDAERHNLTIRRRSVAIVQIIGEHFEVQAATFVLAVALLDRFLDLNASGKLRPNPDPVASAAHTPPLLDRGSPTDEEETASWQPQVELAKQVGAPLACFILATKMVEVFAPRLSDVVVAANSYFIASQADSPPSSPRAGNSDVSTEMTTADLREWEQYVLAALGHQVADVTALDVLHALLGRFRAPVQDQLRRAAEKKLQVGVCFGQQLRGYSPVDLALAALLLAAREQQPPVPQELVVGTIPGRLRGLVTEATRECLGVLDAALVYADTNMKRHH